SQLHKHIPSTAETYAANCSAIQSQNIFQAINRLVLQGITVCINLKFAVAFNIYKFSSAEKAMVRYVFVFSFLNKFRSAALTGQNYISRIPSEFVIPKIIIAFRRNQTSAKRFK